MKYIPVYRIELIRDGSVQVEEKILRSPSDVEAIMRPYIGNADREHFVVAFLNTKNKVIGVNTVSIGSLNSAIVHPREVFKGAILCGAASLIVCHNHPSGDPTPSREDIEVTRRLVEAGKILGIDLLDHVILGDGAIRSLKESNLL